MYSLVKVVVFHCYVSLPEGIRISFISRSRLESSKVSVFPRKRLAYNEECLGGLPCGRRGERGVLRHVSSEYVAQRRLLD